MNPVRAWHTADVEVLGLPVELAESRRTWQRLRSEFHRSGMWPFLSSLSPEEWQFSAERAAPPSGAGHGRNDPG